MTEPILVTQQQFEKSAGTFRAATDVGARVVSADEAELARAVRDTGARAVVLGVERYTGPLYEALALYASDGGAILARFGVGHDGIDKDLARHHGIVVTNTPGVLDVSVAEHAVWLLGALARRVASLDAAVKSGTFEAPSGIELAGKTLGIIGLGQIGRRVAAIAHFGLRMRVVALDTRAPQVIASAEGITAEQFAERYGIDEYTNDARAAFAQADALSIHLPATEATRHFLSAKRIGCLRPGALVVNTSRGSLVDEVALYDALAAERLGGAALDVFDVEPYRPARPDKDLRRLTNVVLTPHVGSNTLEANRRMAERCLHNIRAFLAGKLEQLDRVD